MKIKTVELIDGPLDWAVARVLGKRPSIFIVQQTGALSAEHRYSSDWSQSGPIIEREKINIGAPVEGDDVGWTALIRSSNKTWSCGPTPLIAAMRCFVTSKLGDEIDVPDTLANQAV